MSSAAVVIGTLRVNIVSFCKLCYSNCVFLGSSGGRGAGVGWGGVGGGGEKICERGEIEHGLCTCTER